MTILIADDHKNMLNSIKLISEFAFECEQEITFVECTNCQDAIEKTDYFLSKKRSFDLAILDYMMPPYFEKNILNGGEICLYLQKVMPSCKTLINTGLLEDFVLFEIDQKIKPDALILKSDLDADQFIEVIRDLISGKKFRSQYVLDKVSKLWESEIFINEQNRLIVLLISKGFKIKEIAQELALSETAINKRILKIKKTLDITDDTSILKEAKKRGYI